MPAGGRGYTRPPSLISLWSTAPFLLNNSVGPFEQDPSVDARMRVVRKFDRADAVAGKARTRQFPGRPSSPASSIERRPAASSGYPSGSSPTSCATSEPLHDLLPKLIDADGSITIGPIPPGVPVNLLANLQPLAETDNPIAFIRHYRQLFTLLVRLKGDLLAMPSNASDADLLKIFADLKEPLLELNKCPDFAVNSGHYFGTRQLAEEQALSDEDKRALIEFIKTF